MHRVPRLPEPLRYAVPQGEFLDGIEARLRPHGFSPGSTLAAVSICRDELTQQLIAEVTRRWGPTFSLGGLGGIPSLGRTGWGACLSHVPDTEGRGKLLVIGASHIGVRHDGSLGENLRFHQHDATATCGALRALLQTWGEHPPSGPDASGLGDVEAELLRGLVEAQLGSAPADIVELTTAATAAVEHEMTAQLEALGPWDRMDVAVFSGIQLHLDGIDDLFVEIHGVLHGEHGTVTAL
ncbi:MAG: hypothetical protein R2716_11880 [Microthrixaceae bacterium]